MLSSISTCRARLHSGVGEGFGDVKWKNEGHYSVGFVGDFDHKGCRANHSSRSC